MSTNSDVSKNVVDSGDGSAINKAEYVNDSSIETDPRYKTTVLIVPEEKHRSVSEKISDASITGQINSILSTRMASASKITVITLGGEVTLTGTVRDSGEKILITSIVRVLRGVNSIKDQMTIETP